MDISCYIGIINISIHVHTGIDIQLFQNKQGNIQTFIT